MIKTTRVVKTLSFREYHSVILNVDSNVATAERLLLKEALIEHGYQIDDGLPESYPYYPESLREFRDMLKTSIGHMTLGIPTNAKVEYISPTLGLFNIIFTY
ncbi:hypothetical protein PQB86_gp272 [Klebsiella phage Miami]|uniref:Uncharacterized protein n=1 Tax=Klebsiella phage Miami TaxID=2767581 RepID=A0A873WD53_9CAUD|nr:hypothetical protein [Klebsiella quasipneumoniae]YP_010667451.1 hypothetical protein PQB86_gp272 [Klebsiella phage Miami]QPB09367.1 hypothetical protein CPT_Miami_272 [Klebsiella phage Miami]WPH68791.1 hypothetical protein [Stenotrophomonas phage BUCTxx100]